MTEMPISEIIRLRRLQLRYSQEKLASLTGLTRDRIGRIERGVSYIRLDSLGKLLHVLGFEMRMTEKQEVKP